MKLSPQDQRYILENVHKIPLSQIASHLGIKEKKVKTFLANYSSPSQRPVAAVPLGSGVWKIVGLIFLTSFLVYSGTFHSSFHFDDMKEIIQNPAVQQLPDVSPVWERHKTRFLTYLSFALNHFFGKKDVLGYHLVNILIHALSAAVLFFLVRLLCRTPKMLSRRKNIPEDLVALFAALLFAAHPLQTQAVTYIVQRAASLAAFFYYASMFFYVRHRLAGKRSVPWLSVAAAAGAIFSKPIAATLPIVIFLTEGIFFGRESARKNLKALIPFVAVAALPAIFVGVYGSTEFSGVADITKQTIGISRGDYALTQLRVLGTYLRLLFVPVGQNLDYDYRISHTFFEPAVMASFALIAAVLYGAWRLLQKDPLAAFGIFFFFITLMPESSFYPLIDVIFEHRLYLPMAGFALFSAQAVSYILQNKKKYTAGLSVIVLLFGGMAYVRNTVWKDEKTLWEDVIRKSPHKAGPYGALGMYYMQAGQPDKAIEYFEKVIYETPHAQVPIATTEAGAYLNLGVLYGRKGDVDREIGSYEKAIACDPGLTDAYLNAGVAYGKKGDLDREMEFYRKAAEKDARSPRVYNNLGAALIDRGRREEAIAELQKAVQLDPFFADAHCNLGLAYAGKGDASAAREEARKLRELGQEEYARRIEQKILS